MKIVIIKMLMRLKQIIVVFLLIQRAARARLNRVPVLLRMQTKLYQFILL